MSAEPHPSPASRLVSLLFPAGGPDQATGRTLTLVILAAVAVRLAVFVGAIVWPIPNENLFPVSPLSGQGYRDFDFYLHSLEQYRNLSLADLLGKFVAFYQRPLEEQFGHIIAGPVFPALIEIFGYRQGNTLPMALFYLALDCLWIGVWLKYLSARGMRPAWLVALAAAPNPVWFMLVISPDLVFAALVGFFFHFYMRAERRPRDAVMWAGVLILILLTRPNGYSILLFVLVDFAWRQARYRQEGPWGLLSVALLALLFGLYLYPYFITEMRKTATDHVFFGFASSAYAEGLFRALPEWLNLAASWLALAGARILYFVGLRPAYGAAPDMLVVIRALPGMVLLPGLIFALLRAPRRERLFLVLFLFPIVLGPSQDRYNLPVYPLLFYYGSLFYGRPWSRVGRRPAGP